MCLQGTLRAVRDQYEIRVTYAGQSWRLRISEHQTNKQLYAANSFATPEAAEIAADKWITDNKQKGKSL